MSECNTCKHDAEIEALRRDMERNSAQHREFYSRFSELETKIAVSDEKYANLLIVMTEIKTSVNQIKDKQVKKWDNISAYVTTSIIGLILGYVLNGILGVM